MKLNFGHAASAVTLAIMMMGNAFADQNDVRMPGGYTGDTVVQPGSNPGAVNPPPPVPQNYNNPSPNGVPQDGMMGSPPPPPMPGEVPMGPDGLPQDGSTTTTTAPPPGKSMAPPAGPMGPQNSPPPQSKANVKSIQVSKR